MPSSSHTDRIRESWQPRRLAGAPAKTWLIVRRTIATLIALGLIGFCGWILFRLLWNPHTYFAYLTASTYEPLGGQPVAYVSGDFNAMKALSPAFAESDLADPFESFLTKETLERRLTDLAELGIQSKDTVIVYLTAHGVARDGKAYLLCEPGGKGAELPVEAVLQKLKSVPAGTKLLILDAGRDNHRSQFGMAVNTFPKLLEEEVRQSNDPALWVLSANAALERSHTSPSKRRSVFGYVLSNGLGGGADEDQDQVIRLDELYRYVQNGASAWVAKATSMHETQTPLLFHCDDEKLEMDSLAERVLLSTKRLPADAAADVENDVAPPMAALSELASEQAEEIKPEALDTVAEKQGPRGEGGGDAQGGTADDSAPSDGKSGRRTDYARDARQQINTAWLKLKSLETAAGPLLPGAFAPPFWRELVDRLLWYDQALTVGIPANHARWGPMVKELRSLNASLEAYGRGELAGAANGNVVERLQAHHPQVLVEASPDAPISAAMLEQIAAALPDRPLPNDLAAFLKTYDDWLAQGEEATAEAFDALFVKVEEGKKDGVPFDEPKSLYELRLVDFLRGDAEIPWSLARLALETRRTGERVAANLLCGEGWARETIDAADQLRWEGERLILDRTNSNWIELADSKLTEAQSRYAQARRELELVAQLGRERNRLLGRVPDYVRWAHISRGNANEVAADTAAVKNLLAVLGAVNEALAKPSRDSYLRLDRLHGQLQESSQAVEKRTSASGEFWRIANLWATSLPDAAGREQLRSKLANAESELLRSFNMPTADPVPLSSLKFTDPQRKEISQQIDLESSLAQLMGYEQVSVDYSDLDLDKLAAACDRLAEQYAQLPESIASTAKSGDLQNAEGRVELLADLRSKMGQWLLLGPQHRNKLEPTSGLVAALYEAAWHDLLQWQHARFRRAAVDAPLLEAAFLRNAAENYRRLANRVPGPAVEPLIEPPLEFDEAPNSISLVSEEAMSVPFTIRAHAEAPTRLVAQFNSDLLQIDGDEVPAESADYPIGPDEAALRDAAELPLSAGDNNRFAVRATRTPNARGSTKLILKAITGEVIIRHEVDVELPGRKLLDLAVDAGREFWDSTNAEITLHPLPNRLQDFTFSIINHTKEAKELGVSFWMPAKAPDDDRPLVLPAGAQTQETASKLLESFGTLTPLGPEFPVKLPATAEPVRVRLADDPKGESAANLLLQGGEDPKKFPGILLRRGLLVKLTDRENGDTTIRRIQIAPQRPPRYLTATAQYDQSAERLQVVVTADNQNVVPETGLPVRLDVSTASASRVRDSKLTGELTAPTYSTTLYAHLSPNPPAEVTAYVHVDGYPRGFVFRIPTYQTSENIPPVDDAMDVRIIEPRPGTAYRAPAGAVPVVVEIDAPTGAFEVGDGTSFAQVGLDWDRDREFDNEQPLTLHSDRQIAVAAKSFSPAGTLTLDTRVRDFRLNVPAAGSNKAADLLGRLVTQLGEKRSDPVEILLDGEGPSIHAELRQGREIEGGAELEIRVFTDPPDLSGVRKVEVIFDVFEAASAEEAKWEEAKPDGEGGWIARLKTDNLLGQQYVLARAVDMVGNVGHLEKPEGVRIVPKQAAAASDKKPPADVANIVVGQVTYRDRGVQAKVELTGPTGASLATMSKADGRFQFPKVSPGGYVLKATSVEAVQNYFRTGQTNITVPPRPEKSPPVTLKLQQRQ